MSVRIMSAVWSDESIKNQSKLLVLLALADFSDDQGVSWPSVGKLAEKSRLCERSTQKVLSALRKDGKISVKYEASQFGSNIYTILTGGVHQMHPANPAGVSVGAPNPSLHVLSSDIHTEVHTEGSAEGNQRTPRLKFTPPSFEQMKQYGTSISLSDTEIEKCFDYYSSKGWFVGKSPMKDWKAAMRNWKRNVEDGGFHRNNGNGQVKREQSKW